MREQHDPQSTSVDAWKSFANRPEDRAGWKFWVLILVFLALIAFGMYKLIERGGFQI